MPEIFFGFDVGNTRVKAGLFRNGKVSNADAVPLGADLERWLEGFVDLGRAKRALISTVNPGVSDRIRDSLERRTITVEPILESNGWLFEAGLLGCDLQTPQTTGVDRLLSAIAALGRSPGKVVIVVDCGSAITINLTTADRVFHGGAILPGFRLMAECVNTRTAALPRVDIKKMPEPIGRSTASAIEAGIFFGIAGGVDRLVAEFTKAESVCEPVVYLTGGDAELLGPGLRTAHQIMPNLVLEGLFEVGVAKR